MSQSSECPAETERLRLPGFGEAVDANFSSAFPSAIEAEWESMGITLREQRMMAFVSDVSDKAEWERKVFDEEIVAKWRGEAERRPEELEGDVVLSKEMFDFVGSLRTPFLALPTFSFGVIWGVGGEAPGGALGVFFRADG